MNTNSLDKEDNYLQIEESSSTPVQSMEQKNLKEVLAMVIQTLSPVNANIVTLYYQGEKSVKEIAQILDLSESNVKDIILILAHKPRKGSSVAFNHTLYQYNVLIHDIYFVSLESMTRNLFLWLQKCTNKYGSG